MSQNKDAEIIQKYVNNLTDSQEQEIVQSLFSDEEENQVVMRYLQNDWNESLMKAKPEFCDLQNILDHIHHIIHMEQSRKENTLTQKIFRWYSLAAAIILIPVLFAGGFLISQTGSKPASLNEQSTTSTLFAPPGSRISFTLPDGSHGWLNSGSSLVYDIPFRGKRLVILKGQAFFDIVHDADNPFVISSGNTQIKVLGTRFDVNAYGEEDYVEVVLESGKLEFSIPGNSTAVMMAPNERLLYQNGSVNLSHTDPAKYVAWKEGKLVFRGDPMLEVVRRIERWYNVKVEIIDKQLEQYVFRATFQDDSLEEVLRLLSLTSPIGYKIIDRKTNDEGYFEKKKVMLYRMKK